MAHIQGLKPKTLEERVCIDVHIRKLLLRYKKEGETERARVGQIMSRKILEKTKSPY